VGLPDPRSPLNRMDKLVYGETARRHPVTGFPLQMGGHGSVFPAPPPDVQARGHLLMIYRDHGKAAHDRIKAALDEFERKGGVVEMPTEALTDWF
jgi:hypothetical protein